MNDEHPLTPDPEERLAEHSEKTLTASSSTPATPKPSPEERRRRPRFEVSVRVHLTIFAELPATPLSGARDTSRMRVVREGFSKDLSETGVCVILDDRVTGVPLQQLVGRKVKLHLESSEPDTRDLKVLGQVAWGRERDGVVKLGIQFTDVSAEDRKALEQLCQGDESELSRISNLWELLVAEPRNLSN